MFPSGIQQSLQGSFRLPLCAWKTLQHRKSLKQKSNELSSINIFNFSARKGVHKNLCISFGCRQISFYISVKLSVTSQYFNRKRKGFSFLFFPGAGHHPAARINNKTCLKGELGTMITAWLPLSQLRSHTASRWHSLT